MVILHTRAKALAKRHITKLMNQEITLMTSSKVADADFPSESVTTWVSASKTLKASVQPVGTGTGNRFGDTVEIIKGQGLLHKSREVFTVPHDFAPNDHVLIDGVEYTVLDAQHWQTHTHLLVRL